MIQMTGNQSRMSSQHNERRIQLGHVVSSANRDQDVVDDDTMIDPMVKAALEMGSTAEMGRWEPYLRRE